MNIKPLLHAPVAPPRAEAENPVEHAAATERLPDAARPEEAGAAAPAPSADANDPRAAIAGILDAELAHLAPEHREAIREQLEKDPLLLELAQRALKNGGNI